MLLTYHILSDRTDGPSSNIFFSDSILNSFLLRPNTNFKMCMRIFSSIFNIQFLYFDYEEVIQKKII